MDRTTVINLVLSFTNSIKSMVSFDKIILFGSYAKGTADENSDIDVAVLVNNYEGDVLELSSKLWLAASKISDYIEPVLLDYKDDTVGFISEVMNTGIIVAE
jgi:predicted nucleotidyltransferase